MNIDFKKYDAVIFDMDGTLLDSMQMWLEIDQEFLSARGLDFPSDLKKHIEGMSFTETTQYFIDRFDLPEDVETLKKIWIDMADEHYSHKIKMKPGALAFLDYLYQSDIPMGIATSNSPELVEKFLWNRNLHKYFKTVNTSCQVERGKPFPYIYQMAARELGVDPERCLAFEDTEAGVDSAKAAGMTVVSIFDEASEDFLDEIIRKSDYFIKSFEELEMKNEKE